jgi:hypothetical protein
VLIFVLLAAAALTAVMGHWVDTLVILGVTVINALIGHVQESNAEKSLQGIRNMLSSNARCSATVNMKPCPPATWCRGYRYSAGGRPRSGGYASDRNPQPARGRGDLTGESTVVDKITDALQGELPLGDRTNMVFPVPPSAPAVASAW